VDDHATALLPAATVVPPGTGRRALPRLGGVANPAREGLAPLTFAASELRTAAAALAAADDDLLVGPDATVDRLLAVMGRCSHLHLACHGQFRPDDALESCLRLADGDLSLRTMQRVDRLADLDLLVLSACESAQSDTDVLPDEMIGLPTAFLQLGARAVVGALWPIPDLPTQLLMARLYRHLVEDNLAVGQALRQAQNWLRAATVGDIVAALDTAASDDVDGGLLRAGSRIVERTFGPGERPFAHESAWAGFVMLGHSQEADHGD
jgi:CHAT domain-containing protein